MKSEYLVETYDSVSRDEFFLIVTLRNKKTFFIGLFKKNEKEKIKKEIFNLFLLKETPQIEELKKKRKSIHCLFSCRNTLAAIMRKSTFYKKSEELIFIK